LYNTIYFIDETNVILDEIRNFIKKKMKALIFAAGLGTRLKPYTDDKPKALVQINGIPLLQLAIEKLYNDGFDEIVVNVHAFGQQIIDFVQNHSFNAKIYISDERNELLDTGGGLVKALPFFDDAEPFLVYNVDIITTADLRAFYLQHMKNNSLVSMMVRKRETSRYLLFDSVMNLVGWRNNANGEEIWVNNPKTDVDAYAFSGIHVVDPKIAKYAIDKRGPFSIIPFYLETAKHECFKGVLDSNSIWFDVGKEAQLKEAALFLSANE